MVEIRQTDEGKKVDDQSWKDLRLDELPSDKLIELARMQRRGSIVDFTRIISLLIGNEHKPKKKGIQQLDK